MMRRTLISCAKPVWADEAHTAIVCTALFKEVGEALQFKAIASDVEPHGQDLFKRLIAGEFGPIAEYMPATAERLPTGGGPHALG